MNLWNWKKSNEYNSGCDECTFLPLELQATSSVTHTSVDVTGSLTIHDISADNDPEVPLLPLLPFPELSPLRLLAAKSTRWWRGSSNLTPPVASNPQSLPGQVLRGHRIRWAPECGEEL